MSEGSGSGSTAIVAIVALIFLAVAGIFAYQNGMFGEKEKAGVTIEFNAPK